MEIEGVPSAEAAPAVRDRHSHLQTVNLGYHLPGYSDSKSVPLALLDQIASRFSSSVRATLSFGALSSLSLIHQRSAVCPLPEAV